MVTIEQFHRRLNRGAGFEKYDYEEAATLHAFATRFARIMATITPNLVNDESKQTTQRDPVHSREQRRAGARLQPF